MTRRTAETVVIGSGFAGALVARELVRAGGSVTIVERGSRVPWDEQVRSRRWESDSPASAHNHESDATTDWQYVYGVGGTSNAWTGNAPRLLPEDFELRSRHGVARDWPLSYDEIEPYYAEAEAVLGVAGQRNGLTPGAEYPLPPHPFSPQDRALAPLLEPFIPMPQARPTRPVRGRPACSGVSDCMYCPDDARFTVLNGLADVLAHPNVDLLDETMAAKLVQSRSSARVVAVECIRANGERVELEAERFVVAANAIESAGLLLRSGIDHGDTGRNLLDHRFADVMVRTRMPVGPGRGSSLSTGASYAYYSGEFRSERAGVLIYPRNPGAGLSPETVVHELLAGRRGGALRQAVADDWERTLKLVISPDELPSQTSRVTLSPRTDRFGLPLNRIQLDEPSDYQQRAIRHVQENLPRRLAPLGVRAVSVEYPRGGSHSVGTLRMGTDENAVVDPSARHSRYDNLFVAGGAVFPSLSPSHPTLTIAALALRLGESLARGSS